MNPFITLTSTDGGSTTINIHNIVCYEPRVKSKTGQPYTYIVLNAGNTVTREVRETLEEVSKIIQNVYYQIGVGEP